MNRCCMRGGVSGRSPGGVEPVETVEMIDVLVGWRVREPERRQPLEQRPERNLQFDTGKGRADAEVDAGTETDIGAVGPERIEGVGGGKARRIAIGRSEHQ